MKLSTQADYAVRAVYELSRHDPGAVLHTGDIASAQHIPGPRLAKVIHDLARADLVRTQRGHQGGVMLARPPAEITVRDVYEAVEGPILLCRCRQRVEPCADDGCDTHEFWQRCRDAPHRGAADHDVRGPDRRAATRVRVQRPPAGDGEVTIHMAVIIKEQVEKALGDIRPALQADGGDIELVDVLDDGVVQVRLQGACAGCPMSQLTLTNGVERHLKNVVPGVERVENMGF